MEDASATAGFFTVLRINYSTHCATAMTASYKHVKPLSSCFGWRNDGKQENKQTGQYLGHPSPFPNLLLPSNLNAYEEARNGTPDTGQILRHPNEYITYLSFQRRKCNITLLYMPSAIRGSICAFEFRCQNI